MIPDSNNEFHAISETHELAKRSAEYFLTNFNGSQEQLEEGLGIAVSMFCNWTGESICNVFLEALEDANFHHLADDIADAMQLNGIGNPVVE